MKVFDFIRNQAFLFLVSSLRIAPEMLRTVLLLISHLNEIFYYLLDAICCQEVVDLEATSPPLLSPTSKNKTKKFFYFRKQNFLIQRVKKSDFLKKCFSYVQKMKLSSYRLNKLLKFQEGTFQVQKEPTLKRFLPEIFQEMELFLPKFAKPEKPEILIFLNKSYLHILE